MHTKINEIERKKNQPRLNFYSEGKKKKKSRGNLLTKITTRVKYTLARETYGGKAILLT